MVAMVVVAEGAAWLLAPDGPASEPEAVDEGAYFDAEQLERARDYRGGQRALMLAGIAAQGLVLVALVSGRPRGARSALERLGERPVVGAVAAGASLSVTVALVALPFDVAAHERALDVGLSTQSIGPWLGDFAKGTAITAILAGAGAALLLTLMRRFPRGWWLPAAAGVVAVSAIFSWLGPVLLAPLFNRFDPLPGESPIRAEVLELGRRGGVDIGEVYRVDASRRSTALNAYVGGLGPTKRVVLYDNLIEAAERPELRSVVAHELGHVDNDDILRGLAFVALIAPLGLLWVREAAGAMASRAGTAPSSPAALPAYALALALAGFVLNVPGNQLSRDVERAADDYALELTGDPRALIDLQRRLTTENVSDPDPPGYVELLFGTHPPTVERIGAALAYERNESTVD
ncbi:MAG: M48 family metalloprotease [Solirubrobacterales bacterium]